jgi:predicted ATP-dependent serine protease
LLEEVIGYKNKGEGLLASITQYEAKTEMRSSPFFKLKFLKPADSNNKPKLLPQILEGLKQNAESVENNNAPENMDATPNEINEQSTNKEKYPEVETNGRIISSKMFREMTYPALIFQNRWNDFFGEPSTIFHCVVHGKPGEGKSTFCIQFAYYLAKHHGNTIYISGEEGFSKTLQQKVNLTNAEHPRLFFTDLKSFDEIKENIKDEFHFIFIDSLDTLRIDSQKLKELKTLHPASALITISQSTKDGKMRGSQEIIHDADIEVCIQKGIAITNKNRFKEKDMQFSVFQKIKKEK